MPISLRVVPDLAADAEVTRTGPDALLVCVAPWVTPVQRVALLFFVAGELENPLFRPFQVPAGQLAAHIESLVLPEITGLVDRPQLTVTEWEQLIFAYAGEDK